MLGVVAAITLGLFLPALLVSPGYYLGKYLFSVQYKGWLAILALLPVVLVILDTFLGQSRVLNFCKKKQEYLRNLLVGGVLAFGTMLVG